jgi:hypothetical protein
MFNNILFAFFCDSLSDLCVKLKAVSIGIIFYKFILLYPILYLRKSSPFILFFQLPILTLSTPNTQRKTQNSKLKTPELNNHHRSPKSILTK